jgi:hypothetical protein
MKARDVSRPRPRLTNKWHPCPKGHTKIFSWYVAFTTVPIVLISIFRQESPYCEKYVCVSMSVCMYTHTHTHTHTLSLSLSLSDYVETVYDYCCYQILLRVEHFCTNRELCEVSGYLSLGRRLGGDWVYT